MALKTDYKDAAWSGDRLYKITDAGSGKSTIEDVTSYTVSGDNFGAKDINATNKAVNDLLDKMTTLGKSVSDGKTLVAAAITAKKVAATVSDSFATLAEKIGQIVLGSGNATAADVLKGKTFTNSGGVELTGTMPDHSAKGSLGGISSNYPNVPIHKGTYGQFCTPTESSERLFAVRPDKGYWNGDTYVGAPATTKTVTPSTAQQTVSPDSGGVLEKVVVGAIPNQRGTSQKSAKCYTYKHTDGITYLVNWLLAGWYSAWQPTSGTATYAEVWTKQADVATAIGLTASMLSTDKTLLGIKGSRPFINPFENWNILDGDVNFSATTWDISEENPGIFMANLPPATAPYALLRVRCKSGDDNDPSVNTWVAIGVNTYRWVPIHVKTDSCLGFVNLLLYRKTNGDIYYAPVSGSTRGIYGIQVKVLAGTNCNVSQW